MQDAIDWYAFITDVLGRNNIFLKSIKDTTILFVVLAALQISKEHRIAFVLLNLVSYLRGIFLWG